MCIDIRQKRVDGLTGIFYSLASDAYIPGLIVRVGGITLGLVAWDGDRGIPETAHKTYA